MRILALVLAISLALASPMMSVDLSTLIGESCDKTPTFNITSFNVSPYPFGPSQQYTINVAGTFFDKVTINQIYVATRFERKSWTYNYIQVNQEFKKGQQWSTPISVQAPAAKGTYTNQITFHKDDFSSCSCWQYDYSLA